MSDQPLQIVFADTETVMFTDYVRAPEIVCGQIQTGSDDAPAIYSALHFLDRIETAFWDGDVIVFQNTCYDMACILAARPDLADLIFDRYEEGKIQDVAIRERLVMLGRYGTVDHLPTYVGSGKTSYSLGAMTERRLGIHLGGKDDADETRWRANFEALKDIPITEWPKEAIDYALGDVIVLPMLYESQITEARDHVPLENAFKAATVSECASFALYLMTCQGIAIDEAMRDQIAADLQRDYLTSEKLEPLFRCGILRRPKPALPYVRQVEEAGHIVMHWRKSPGARPLNLWETISAEERSKLEEAGIKFKPPEPISKDTKVLQAKVEAALVMQGLDVSRYLTETGKAVSCADEVLIEVDHKDPDLAAYREYQSVQKLITTELPRIQRPRVSASFDVLKETGRTSAFDINLQNVDPRIRPCYVPDPGWLILSCDYSTIELVTTAQKNLDLFGESEMARLINAGVDLHAYLGAVLAFRFDQEKFFEHTGLKYEARDLSREELYQDFLSLKPLHRSHEGRIFFDHYRKMAKPTNLGYPGGLGADTFVVYAKATYGVIVTREQAVALKELWLETFPEMTRYFRWVNEECSRGDDQYAYVSPLGMLRNGCSYCACANGAAMQTPAGEGGKLGLWLVTRHCYDPSKASPIYGCRPWAWVHDELLMVIPDDEWVTERAEEVCRLLVQGMRHVIPDVAVKANPALMRRWYKEAEEVRDANGRLIPWEPATTQRSA